MIARTFAAVLLLFASGANAQPQTGAQPRILTVGGEGDVKAKPDLATLTAGVISDGKTAAVALSANSRAMNAVFDTLKRLGIPERAIRTSQVSVEPQYPDDSRQPRRITGYQVSNSVTVMLDNLERVGPALDALVTSGANSVGDIAFSVRDPKPLLAEAREAAVKDAASKAETLARAAGVALGPILQIAEGGISGPPQPMMRMAVAAREATPVAPGEETISASVSVTWEIR
ncbi:MAG: SIMPL domain-containing protein [Alphaproteobacteria bacterium]|nr:SIMPL domain-containing protein [Alphaproteobacteria bacterium]